MQQTSMIGMIRFIANLCFFTVFTSDGLYGFLLQALMLPGPFCPLFSPAQYLFSCCATDCST